MRSHLWILQLKTLHYDVGPFVSQREDPCERLPGPRRYVRSWLLGRFYRCWALVSRTLSVQVLAVYTRLQRQRLGPKLRSSPKPGNSLVLEQLWTRAHPNPIQSFNKDTAAPLCTPQTPVSASRKFVQEPPAPDERRKEAASPR